MKKIKTGDTNNLVKKKKLNKLWLLIIFVLFVILIFSGIKLVFWFLDNNKTNNTILDINDMVNIVNVAEEETELINEPDDKNSDYWYYVNFPLIQVDFRELIKKNSETIGWIHVNNTNINYPIVQTSDNKYYLNHSYDRSVNEAGWVFADYRNNSDFSSKNTIIYAHSRLNKTMFGSLSNVLKYSWYENKDNHIIKLSTPNENSLWQIFSVYKIKTESYYITTDFYSDGDYIAFLNTLRDRSLYDFDVTLNESDNIITLSTCYSDDMKTVVHAKKIKKANR